MDNELESGIAWWLIGILGAIVYIRLAKGPLSVDLGTLFCFPEIKL